MAAVGVAWPAPSHGELVDLRIHNVYNGIDTVTTFQLVATFNSPLDQIEAVFGNSERNLRFGGNTGGGLWNDDLVNDSTGRTPLFTLR